MPVNRHDYDDDDYVARLLAEDAKKSSQRYAAVGLAALLPQRRTTAAPKPNTRFLNHLVREVDSHNTALKKKEELEARIRLREMRESKRRDADEKDSDHRRKRRRTDVHGSDESKRARRRGASHDRSRNVSPHRPRDRGDRDQKQKLHTYDDKSNNHQRNAHSRSHHSRNSEDPAKHQERPKHSPAPEIHPPSQRTRRSRRSTSPSSRSDSTDDLVGPRLPSSSSHLKVRGRGAQTSSRAKSNIDNHFSSTYDPSLDVHPEDEASSGREDWDMALEALRDRKMWQKKQSQRMREAGFEEEQIKNWTKGLNHFGPHEQGDIGNVRWAKKGEAREWDLGKKGVGCD